MTPARAALATAAVAGVTRRAFTRALLVRGERRGARFVRDAPRPSAARLAGAGTCGGGVQGCELYSPRDCRGRVYSYKPGALAHLQGGKSAATVLAPLGARVTTPAKSLVADNPGLCDVYESIDGGNFDWANPEATAAARVGEGRRRRTAASSSSSSLSARLGGGASGCETDVGGFDGATLDQCRDACKRAAGCESFHSFHVTATDGSFATDDYSCRLCGPGGEGAFVPPPGNVETARGPAWCLTKHNLTMRVESLEECANACDATEGCDAFNHGAFDGDCLLLELGASAKRGMLWRASGMSPTGVVGYATYYAMTGAEVNAALRDETGELMAPGAGDSSCVGNLTTPAPRENLALHKKVDPPQAWAVVDGKPHGASWKKDGSCPFVVKGTGAKGRVDVDVEIDLQGEFTVGRVRVEAAPGDVASALGEEAAREIHRNAAAARLGKATRTAAVVEALSAHGEWLECGVVGPFDGAKGGAPETFEVDKCDGVVASRVRASARDEADLVMLCEIEVLAANHPARKKRPEIPAYLEDVRVPVPAEHEGSVEDAVKPSVLKAEREPAAETLVLHAETQGRADEPLAEELFEELEEPFVQHEGETADGVHHHAGETVDAAETADATRHEARETNEHEHEHAHEHEHEHETQEHEHEHETHEHERGHETHGHGIEEIVIDAEHTVEDGFENAGESAEDAGDAIADAVEDGFEQAGESTEDAGDAIADAAAATQHAVEDGFKNAGERGGRRRRRRRRETPAAPSRTPRKTPATRALDAAEDAGDAGPAAAAAPSTPSRTASRTRARARRTPATPSRPLDPVDAVSDATKDAGAAISNAAAATQHAVEGFFHQFDDHDEDSNEAAHSLWDWGEKSDVTTAENAEDDVAGEEQFDAEHAASDAAERRAREEAEAGRRRRRRRRRSRRRASPPQRRLSTRSPSRSTNTASTSPRGRRGRTTPSTPRKRARRRSPSTTEESSRSSTRRRARTATTRTPRTTRTPTRSRRSRRSCAFARATARPRPPRSPTQRRPRRRRCPSSPRARTASPLPAARTRRTSPRAISSRRRRRAARRRVGSTATPPRFPTCAATAPSPSSPRATTRRLPLG